MLSDTGASTGVVLTYAASTSAAATVATASATAYSSPTIHGSDFLLGVLSIDKSRLTSNIECWILLNPLALGWSLLL